MELRPLRRLAHAAMAMIRTRPGLVAARIAFIVAIVTGISIASTGISQLLTSLPQTISNFAPPKAMQILHRSKQVTEVGMNLSGISYYDESFPFLDRMKTSSTWSSGNKAVPVDKNGYPTALTPGQKGLQVQVSLDPSTAGASHQYVLSYDGNATVSMSGATVVSKGNGQVVFNYTGNGGATLLTFTYPSTNPQFADKISLVRQDQMDLFKGGEIFNPAFISKISSFSNLRFMDWGNTNGSTVVNWSDRTTMSYASWASNSKTSSVPLEVMVALANETGKGMWYNIPAQASDDYVKQALTYIRDNLKPGITLHLEYSNEVWNSGFAQNQYAATMATALWGKVTDPAEQYYGYRSAQIASMAKTIFGKSAATRLDAVLGTQTAYSGREKNIFAGVARAGLGSVGDLFKEYAVTTYFGGQLSGATSADQATVLAWAQSGAAGVDKAFAELSTGGALSSNQSMKTILGWLAYQEGVANANGLSMVAYEGGIDLTAFHYTAAQQPIIIAFFNRILADPRMGALYNEMVSGFSAAGGHELTAFNEVGKTTVWGSYGALDNIYQDSSVRFDALVAAAKAGSTAAAAAALPAATATSAGPIQEKGTSGNDTLGAIVGQINQMSGGGGNDIYHVDSGDDAVTELFNAGTDEVRTALASYTLGPNVENLTYLGTARFTGTGNDLANVINGGNGGANLYGGVGNDTLTGGAGNDVLDGGAGADRMIGGAGNDTYYVDSPYDVVIEQPGGGTDTVYTTLAKYNLADNVENLTYNGTSASTMVGNDLANIIHGSNFGGAVYGGGGDDTLYGGDGADTLVGGAGRDTMIGGKGDDTYSVDDPNDVVVEEPGGGNDRVNTTVSYQLSANVEQLFASGIAPVSLTGNNLDNQISGNDAANLISGGAGKDVIWGNGGNDTIDGGADNDQLFGGEGDDTIYGGTGDDVIYGGNGNDTIIGGAGNDYMSGGAGADRFVFDTGDLSNNFITVDRITDFSAQEGDKIDVSAIDASSLTAGDQAFSFIGAANFTKQAGQLRVFQGNGCWNVAMDTNGDGVADLCLTVVSKTNLVASDFIL